MIQLYLIITILHSFLIRSVFADTLYLSRSVLKSFNDITQRMNINMLPFPVYQLSTQLGSTNPRLIDIVEEP